MHDDAWHASQGGFKNITPFDSITPFDNNDTLMTWPGGAIQEVQCCKSRYLASATTEPSPALLLCMLFMYMSLSSCSASLTKWMEDGKSSDTEQHHQKFRITQQHHHTTHNLNFH
jgi:hypothetical protein